MRAYITLAAALLFWVQPYAVVAQTTTGSIFGDVTDPLGAAVSGVRVRITNENTGAIREMQTNAAGTYRIAGLPPAGYMVAVEREGFRPMTRAGIVVPIQGEVKIDFRMEIGAVLESIIVTEQAPLVQPTVYGIQTVVDNRRVRDLPLKTRDFMDLALLAPGVVLDQSSVRAGNVDSISFFGVEESYKTIWLEGVDFNDEVTAGGTNISPSTRTRLGQEAVQEFQVMATGYSAEFGRSGTGAINVVVRSGGNDIHGSGFYFLRDAAFDRSPFQVNDGIATQDSTAPPFRKQQYGATAGGPFSRDRAFYFLSVERQTVRESAHVSIPPAVKSFVDSLNMGYDTRSVVPRTREQLNTVGKFSFNLSPANRLDLTYLYDDDNDVNKNVGGSFGADYGFDDLNSSYFATASLTSAIGRSTVNELRVNRSIQRLMRNIPAAASYLPALTFPSVNLGTNGAATPQGRVQRNWIVANSTTRLIGNHTLKWGGEINVVSAPNVTNEQFNGTYRFPGDQPPFAPDRYTAGFNLQFARGESPDPNITVLRRDMAMYAFFVNNTWRARPNLTLNMGLRYDLRRLLGDFAGPDAFEQPGYFRTNPEDVWLDVALGPAGALAVRQWRPVPDDTLDLSPRFGLAWNVDGNGKSVVRASYGIFHDRILSVGLRGAVNRYNGLNIETVQVFNPNFFPQTPNAASLPTTAITVSTVPSPKANTPYTQHWSVGFQSGLSSNTAFSADFVRILGLNLQMIRNVNAPLPLELTGGERVCPFGGRLADKGAPPCLQMRMMHDMSGRMHVNALSLQIEKRFSNRLGFLAGYTLGSVRQWSTGGFGIEVVDAYNKFRELDFGPGDNDVRHRLTSNILYELPYGIHAGAIITANSAAPYNHTTGSDDNLDFILNDRPSGVRFNALRGASFFQTDLRLSKRFPFDEIKNLEVMWEMFNLFNAANLVDFNGNQRSATFGKARAALSPFQAQLGLRFTF